MTPENRAFTKTGLKSIECSHWPGLQEMYSNLMKGHGSVGGIDVMYKFAPLLNAPGRMERPDPALKLLLSPNMATANALMAELREWNSKRKQKEAEITEMAQAQMTAMYGDKLPTVIVVAGNDWHVGVIGIVAAKLAQEYHRPTAVLSIKAAWRTQVRVRCRALTGTRLCSNPVNYLTAGAAMQMLRASHFRLTKSTNSASAWKSLRQTRITPAPKNAKVRRLRVRMTFAFHSTN